MTNLKVLAVYATYHLIVYRQKNSKAWHTLFWLLSWNVFHIRSGPGERDRWLS